MIRGSFRLIPLTCAALTGAMAACGDDGDGLRLFRFEQPHMGTLFTVRLYADGADSARAAADAAFARVAALEEVFSDYEATSEVMRLVEAPPGEPVRVSADMFAGTALALRLSEQTEGAFDITMGPQVRNWRMARRTGALPSAEARAAAQSASGAAKLTLDPDARTLTLAVPGMRLDYGGIAKGLAADAALAVLREMGFPRAVVAGSGDIAVGAPPPDAPDGWRIGIERVAGDRHFLTLRDCGISTSGDRVQFIEIDGRRYSHIVDPRTGLGLENGWTITVIAPTAARSDALATAACVLGARAGTLAAYREAGVRILASRADGTPSAATPAAE